MAPTFAQKIIQFNRKLDFRRSLPEGIRIMNPFQESPAAVACSEAFYTHYYNDHSKRYLILGINPGRFGAGITGVPFTDPKRLTEVCGIPFAGKQEHEPSSVFIYEMIAAYGGLKAFYSDFYISSVCPLGFTTTSPKGREINMNYYDDKTLTAAVLPFILQSIQANIGLGVETDRCYCFGTGKNFQFLNRLNAEFGFFGRIIPLEHPRFIMQYKSKEKERYVQQYLDAFRSLSYNHPIG